MNTKPIIKRMNDLNLTKAEFSRKLGISRQSVSDALNKWENGTEPKISTLNKWEKVLELEKGTLISYL